MLKQGSKQEVDSLVKGMGSGELPKTLENDAKKLKITHKLDNFKNSLRYQKDKIAINIFIL